MVNGEYILCPLGYRVNVSGKNSGGFLTNNGQTFDPVDLTQYGYPADGSIIPPCKLALQLDVFVNGDAALEQSFSGHEYEGQFEMTSSGTCDKQELWCKTSHLQFAFGKWHRYTIDLCHFHNRCGGDFDPTHYVYSRLYFSVKGGAGCHFDLKICNLRLVDLTKAAPALEDDPVGDGTFAVDPPVFRRISLPAGFDEDDVIVAGYDLAEYVAAHRDTPEIRRCLTADDYAPVIQSLCDGLNAAGGGTLYIPRGRYACRSEIAVKSGVTLCGDWRSPAEHPEADGTVLCVYAGKGSVSGTPFISLGSASTVRYLTFWYPEQSYTKPTPYSPTVTLGSYTWAQDLTFINAYTAIKNGPSYDCCPNARNIYATALFEGLHMDCAIDIARLENIDLSPDYWIRSALPGAPANKGEEKELREYLYENAVGMTVARIDWSFITFITVTGYQTGMVFALTSSGAANGQCHDLHFQNCRTGLTVSGVSTTGEMVSNSVFENCEIGVWLTDRGGLLTDGILHLINVSIDASEYAIFSEQSTMVQLIASTVRRGTVAATFGWYTAVNTTFLTAAPQMVLQSGTLSACVMGCVNAAGDPIKVDCADGCALTFDPKRVPMADIPTVSRSEGIARHRAVGNKTVRLAQGLDTTGTHDVTASLQHELDTVKSLGGGILYLIPGNYRLDGSLTVPAGVELCGAEDFGRIPENVGTRLCVYQNGTDIPTVIMERASSLRGVTFHYPEQAHNGAYHAEHCFTEFPYAVQGRGDHIEIVNVSIHNGWNGVDLWTYRCDDHYVDYLAGICLNEWIRVGHGAERGIIRDFQVNPNSINHDWSAEGKDAAFEITLYKKLQNDTVLCKVGDVKGELLYDNFNYSGYAGMQFVREQTGAADARMIGCAMDYTTVCVEVEDAERLDILNLQMVSYNFKLGEELKKKMYFLSLLKTCTATVNVAGAIFWDNPDYCLNVQGGTLNICGLNYFTDRTHLSTVSETGTVNIAAPYLKHRHLQLAVQNGDRVHLVGGYYYADPLDKDAVGSFDCMLLREQNT